MHKAPALLLSGTHLEGVLGAFQSLLNTPSLAEQGFELVQGVVAYLPPYVCPPCVTSGDTPTGNRRSSGTAP